MRTKNVKRLWPVPAALAVVALAAFLAFGLMAATGTQPAEAQSSDANCVVNVAPDGTPTVDDQTTATRPADDCQAMGDMATVKFTGPARQATPLTNPIKLQLLIRDDNGNVEAYLNGTVEWDGTDNEYQLTGTSTPAPAPMKFSYREIEVPLAARNPNTLQYEQQSITISVPGNVYIYQSGVSNLTTLISGTLPDDDQRSELAAASVPITISLLGPPTLGMDGDDRNKIVDDFLQCVLGDADPDGMFDAGTTDPDGIMGNCIPAGGGTDVAQTETTDPPESRSKLVAISGPSGSERITSALDGMGKDHSLSAVSDTANSATVYALVEDEDGTPLPGTQVTFTVTSMPSGVYSTSRTVDSQTVGTDTGQVSDPAVTGDGIVADDAIASLAISNLPTDQGFRVDVAVSAGGVDLGSITITRNGDADSIKGATFSVACLVDNNDPVTEDNYADDTLNLDAEDCEMQSRFAEGDVVVVKAHLEDEFTTVVGGTLEATLDGEDDALTALPATNTPTNTMAWFYVVDDETMLGDHTIVISDAADDSEVPDHTIMFGVAGPTASYEISGETMIPLGGSAMFTVTAKDTNGGVPDFGDEAMPEMPMVAVDIVGLGAGNVRGLDSGMLALDPDTGMGSFTVFAPRDAMDGEVIHIFVGSGDLEETHMATFGAAAPTPGDMLGETSGVGVGFNQGGALQVFWTKADNATGYFIMGINVATFEADRVVPVNGGNVETFNISGLTPGATYDIYVVATGSGGAFELGQPFRVTAAR